MAVIHPADPPPTTTIRERGSGDTHTFDSIDFFRFREGLVVEFSELVAHQDYAVCERAQKGVSSRAFTHGIYAEKDALPYAFNQDYLKARDE